MNTCQHVNLQFREISHLQSMPQNSNSESTPEEITEIITSIYENLYKFFELNSSAECSQCKKIYNFDQKKTGNKTLSKHYRKIQKVGWRMFEEKKSNSLVDIPCLKFFWQKNENYLDRAEKEKRYCVN